MTNVPQTASVDAIYCSKCGAANASWRSTCEHCGMALLSPATGAAYDTRPGRPGYLTTYAILTWIGAVIVLVGGLATMVSEGLLGLLGVLSAAVLIVVGLGVWRQREWARISVIVIQGLSILSETISLVTGESTGLFEIAISVGLIIWFARHGEHFH